MPLRSENIGSKSAEFVVSLDSIVTPTHSLTQSEGQHNSLRRRHSKQQKNDVSSSFVDCPVIDD